MTPAEEAERLHADLERAWRLQTHHYGWETDAESRLDGALALIGMLGLTLMMIGAGTVVWGAVKAWRLWWTL